MASLVATSGRVTAIEFEPELAARAIANLAPYQNVSMVQGDGSSVAFDAADVIYVNAGATRPADITPHHIHETDRDVRFKALIGRPTFIGDSASWQFSLRTIGAVPNHWSLH